ncbi:hypothetical protein [Croceicoccus mobilis]|uniref:Uncharacterized protein n=1 Tax=Croceicoccus mobilis TaxID=1703339 RepID=A0A916Z8W2_9SPHN|nr:hypothetical protein [Croceicoccus mobilis]GGD82298.1 hypothetical protein GCM10010990_35380 [Croceicoccus mobilis]
MKRRRFKLALEPGAAALTRLAQLHDHAFHQASGSSAPLGRELQLYIEQTFPGSGPEQFASSLTANGQLGWNLDAGPDGAVAIVSTPDGAALSAVARILEYIAPEALARPMTYVPDDTPIVAPRSTQSLH